VADRGGRDDAERDLGDARLRDEERVARFEGARNSDDCDRVTGQDEAIGGEVPRILRGEGAEPDPDGKGAEEQDPLLSEQRDQEQRAGGADQCANDPIEALRQDEPALGLRDDEDRDQRPSRLIEIEGEGDEQCEQARGGRLGGEEPRNPSRADERRGRANVRLSLEPAGLPGRAGLACPPVRPALTGREGSPMTTLDPC
jgi:hypothetical protein